jgi:hypothetical protein
LAGSLDAFAAKLPPDGSRLVYSTYLGGALADFAYDIAVDDRGQAHIAGATSSPDFPVVAAAQPLYGGGSSDAFASVLSADGASLSSSTFLGGSGAESLLVTSMGIAVSRSAVLVAGSTNSTDFPVVGPLQPAPGGSVDAFVARISHGPDVRLTLGPGSNARLIAVTVTNNGTLPRTMELKLWVDSEQGRFLLYENGTSLTLAPAEERSLPAVTLPSAAASGEFEVRARLIDEVTGDVLSATCTGNRGRCSDPARDPSPDR